jgi:hypothetical protein
VNAIWVCYYRSQTYQLWPTVERYIAEDFHKSGALHSYHLHIVRDLNIRRGLDQTGFVNIKLFYFKTRFPLLVRQAYFIVFFLPISSRTGDVAYIIQWPIVPSRINVISDILGLYLKLDSTCFLTS